MKNNQYDLVVIGGGAAGFFAAINAVMQNGSLKVIILEKSSKLLSKVKVSGGGRCNVTHHCFDPPQLASHYPRGKKQLKTLFRRYQAEDVVNWFRTNGVKLKVEDDGRMFPITDNSQTIIDCFLSLADRYKIKIEKNVSVEQIRKPDNFEVHCADHRIFRSTTVLIATGGSAKVEAYSFIKNLGHAIVPPIPSLFTFNDPTKKLQDLMGVSVPAGHVKIAGTKFSSEGPILITHWGLSGPAVIRLSAWAAEHLHQSNYQFTILVSWIESTKEEELRARLEQHRKEHPKRRVILHPLFELPQRLWIRLCELSEIPEEKIWSELPNKNLNKLIESLIRFPFSIKGKTTFKEEFVTCGGVDLNEIDIERMESKKLKGLYFAGEVLNIDGETGGFNFQSAWTTSFIAATAIANKQ